MSISVLNWCCGIAADIVIPGVTQSFATVLRTAWGREFFPILLLNIPDPLWTSLGADGQLAS
jgi:hypothetical protein